MTYPRSSQASVVALAANTAMKLKMSQSNPASSSPSARRTGYSVSHAATTIAQKTSPPAKRHVVTAQRIHQVEIYALRDPMSGEVRYIGKARNARRRLATHLRDARSRRTPLYSWIRSLAVAPVIEVLACSIDQRWQELERDMIAQWRQETRLLNVADGGDEPFCSTEQRRKNAVQLNDPANDAALALRALLRRLGQDAHNMGKKHCGATSSAEEIERFRKKSREAQGRIRKLRQEYGDKVAAYFLRDVIERLTEYRMVPA